jgi:hypothetical protein
MASEKEKVTRVFEMTADTALTFFEIVKEVTGAGIPDSEELRITILNLMAEYGHLNRVYDTKRTTDEIVSDFKRHGFKIDDRREQ